MSNEAITRLVVGETYALTLGRPVGQRVPRDSQSALVWRKGEWVHSGAPSKLARLFRPRSIAKGIRLFMKLSSCGSGLAWRCPPALLSGLVLATLMGLGVGYGLSMRPSPTGLPVVLSDTSSPVRIVLAPYAPQPQIDVARPVNGPLPPQLPIDALAGSAPSVRTVPDERSAGRPHGAPAKTIAVDKEPARVPAVLLDEVASTKSHAGASAASPATEKVNARAAHPPKPQERPIEKAPQPTATRGSGLIAITTDGRFAVFTNPTTRLPQQFKVGDPLPGGETVRAIDYKEGKVTTTSKEYSLD